MSMLGMLCLSIQTTKTRTGDVFRGLTRLVIYACRDAVGARGLLAHSCLSFRALLLVLIHLLQLLLSMEDLEPHHA